MMECPAAIAVAEKSRTLAVFDKGQCLLDGFLGARLSLSGGASRFVMRLRIGFHPRWERRAHHA